MRAIRWLFAITVLTLSTRGAGAQARAQGGARSLQDTLPERVAQRVYEAFRRHDLDAMYANYDSVFTYERFGDPAGSHQLRRDDYLRRTKADTAVMRIINGQRIELVRSDVFGAFVNQEWTERFADGREFKHFELFEVRGGKIMREIEGDRLLNEDHRHAPTQQGTGATLGTVVFPNSGSAAAQPSFLRGIALLHSFEYTEAAEAFQAAEEADRTFALAYWLEAFTNSHILWGEDSPAAARAALAKLGPTPAARLAKTRTDRERSYGSAIEAFYAETTLDVRAKAFADSMRHLSARYPKDLEAAAFTSLAIQISNPRGVDREEAIAFAERVVRESPNHPGAVHYLIHATDAPAYADRGLAAARAYAKVAPDAEHAQHMPSHIFLQLGLWDDAVVSNERAWKASREWVKRRGASGASLDFHDLQWLQYMYLQQGRYALARSIIDTAGAVLTGVDLNASDYPDAQYVTTTVAFQYAADTWDWHAMQGIPEVPMPGPSASRRAQAFATTAMYQRAFAAAVLGDTATASKAAARFRAMVDPVGPNVPTSSAIRAREIEAVIATKRGDLEGAIQLLQEASAIEDKFLFVGPPTTLVAHELLGDALVAAKRPAEAVVAYEQELKLTRNRSGALLGLARARLARGDSTGAAEAARRLLANWHGADSDRPALGEARQIAALSPAR